jgi:hypothetical protein
MHKSHPGTPRDGRCMRAKPEQETYALTRRMKPSFSTAMTFVTNERFQDQLRKRGNELIQGIVSIMATLQEVEEVG